jgi:hypothetical protein
MTPSTVTCTGPPRLSENQAATLLAATISVGMNQKLDRRLLPSCFESMHGVFATSSRKGRDR